MNVEYYVKEKLLVEGVFVSLVGDGNGGDCFVRLKHVRIDATLDLTGIQISHHITYVTKLSMLSFITDTKL